MRFNELIEICKDKKNVYIFGHINPDGDCVGATIALKGLLENSGITSTIILKDAPALYDFLEVSKLSKDVIKENIDVAIALDCGDMTRLEIYEDEISKANVLVNIDHHASNTNYGNYNFLDTAASSTCEVIYSMLDDKSIVNREIATAIYTGIVYDTGIFKYSSTSKRTHMIASELVEYKIEFTEIINKLFYYKSIKDLKASARAINNIKLVEDNKIAYSVINLSDIKELGLDKDNTGGIVRILNEIEGVECAFFIKQDVKGYYKVSLRSKGFVDVCAIAKEFGGGGHIKASGCTYDGEPKDFINEVVFMIKDQMVKKTI